MTDQAYVYGDIVPIPAAGGAIMVASGTFRLDQWKQITDFEAPYAIGGDGAVAEFDGTAFKLTIGGGSVTSTPVTPKFRATMHDLCIGLGVHFW